MKEDLSESIRKGIINAFWDIFKAIFIATILTLLIVGLFLWGTSKYQDYTCDKNPDKIGCEVAIEPIKIPCDFKLISCDCLIGDGYFRIQTCYYQELESFLRLKNITIDDCECKLY